MAESVVGTQEQDDRSVLERDHGRRIGWDCVLHVEDPDGESYTAIYRQALRRVHGDYGALHREVLRRSRGRDLAG